MGATIYGKFDDYLIREKDGKSRWDYERIMKDLDAWGKSHSFHYEDFSKVDELVELKRNKNLKISLVIPTLNEEATIGKIVHTMKKGLVVEYPLLDEIVVIDTGSEDNTKTEAKKAGAKFYLSEDILPQYGSYRGKGENLWKGLYATSGDIIVNIDADIDNPHERFVYGIVGPILKHPELGIQISIPFYRRPLKTIDPETGEKILLETGGGRVTEIMGRPIFSDYFPVLANVKQPFGGECTGNRSVLEQFPFPTGYPIELSRLIYVVEKYGLSSISQTNLVSRIHRNQSTYDLSKMSCSILKYARRKAEELGLIQINVEIDESVFRRPSLDADSISLDEIKLTDHIRNPIIELPEYKKKFKK